MGGHGAQDCAVDSDDEVKNLDSNAMESGSIDIGVATVEERPVQRWYA